MTPTVLLIGSGAREHALARSLLAGTPGLVLHCAPGNPGIAAEGATLHRASATDAQAIADLADDCGADLVVIGPEVPLMHGVADAVRARGIPCFGPDAAAAAIEGSKAFAKEVMAAAGIPTARALACTDLAEVTAALDDMQQPGVPFVVKEDGLAAGKGVVVTLDRDEAVAHAQSCLANGSAVLIEEFLDGPEVSLFFICDGERVVPLLPAADFKRAYDNDEGPNTGGMGAYSPLRWVPDDFIDHVTEVVAQPAVVELARRGTPFIGLLYAGLALTSRGVRVVEFNARFGDPETQAVLALLRTPLFDVLWHAATGALADLPPLHWHDGSAVVVVLASQGYPADPRLGDVISGDMEPAPDSWVLQAGTELRDGELVTSGGRVLSCVGVGPDLQAARDRAYARARAVAFDGAFARGDIALGAVAGSGR
ncbi:MAG: phosphoribosylamine--glycine ligase [Actinomycetales bacterium]|nr:phosphoribosylamine--glycine ligase [Actinomycetales bacterium]